MQPCSSNPKIRQLGARRAFGDAPGEGCQVVWVGSMKVFYGYGTQEPAPCVCSMTWFLVLNAFHLRALPDFGLLETESFIFQNQPTSVVVGQ